MTVRLVTPEGRATVLIAPERVDADAPADVTLTGAVETLTAAMDPALVGELGGVRLTAGRR